MVRSFPMVVGDVLAYELSEMRLAQWDHAVEAFLLDRAVEPLDERIQVRAAPGQANRLGPGPRETCTELLREDRISVHDQVLMWEQESVYAVSEMTQHLEHPIFVGLRDDARDVHAPALQVPHDEPGVPHRSAKGQHLSLEEVHRRDGAPVCL